MTPRRERALALGAMLLLLGFAYIGRAVISADDGTDMMCEALGLFVTGRLGSTAPAPAAYDPYLLPFPYLHSRYGLIPSLVFLPFLAIGWPLRNVLGASGLDAVIALSWAAGAAFASYGFLRVARALRPSTSPLWMPAFLAGTYLWPYAADSYIEPWSAGCLGLAGAAILAPASESPFRRALVPSAWWIAACTLRTVLFVTVPVFILAALLAGRGRRDERRHALWLLLLPSAGLALHVLVNGLFYGSFGALGLGATAPPFITPVLTGLLGTTVFPGRGILFYAPVVVAALVAFRRVATPARVLCYGAPLVLLLVAPRWVVWHAGSCWGPRHVLAMLPLLAAPAVLAPRRLSAALLGLGAAANLPGVLVAAGAFQSYAELLAPPAGERWPAGGGDRVSEMARLTPLYGHAWLLSQALGSRPLPAPWLAAGARETARRPAASEIVSPWIVRRALGLPPLRPLTPRLLVRNAAGFLEAGKPDAAVSYAEEALRLDPRDPQAPIVLREARARLAAAKGP